MEYLGNSTLIQRLKIGFLAGSKIAVQSMFPVLDWASDVASHDDISIVSGFHSHLERQVLEFLLQGKCGIICVIARSLYSKIPSVFKSAYQNDRVLFISAEKQHRTSKESAYRRNKLVASLSDVLVTPIISADSSISTILSTNDKHIITL